MPMHRRRRSFRRSASWHGVGKQFFKRSLDQTKDKYDNLKRAYDFFTNFYRVRLHFEVREVER